MTNDCKGALISVTIGTRGRLQVRLISYTTVIATVDTLDSQCESKIVHRPSIFLRAYENKTAS